MARAAKSILLAIMRREQLNNTSKACTAFINQILVEGLLGVVSKGTPKADEFDHTKDFTQQLEKQFATHLHSSSQDVKEGVRKLILKDNYLMDVVLKHKVVSFNFVFLFQS